MFVTCAKVRAACPGGCCSWLDAVAGQRADHVGRHPEVSTLMPGRTRALVVTSCIVLGLALVACDVTSPPVTSGGFTTQGKYPKSVVVGDQASLVAVVTSPARTVLVDIEVYDSAGVKAYQHSWDNETFTANQKRKFTTNWSVPIQRPHRHVQRENRRLLAGLGPAPPLERRRRDVRCHCRRRFDDLELRPRRQRCRRVGRCLRCRQVGPRRSSSESPTGPAAPPPRRGWRPSASGISTCPAA